MSNFLARQRLDDAAGSGSLKPTDEPDEDEVDHSLAHLNSAGIQSAPRPVKGRVQTIEWDEELENMSREKATADANRGEWGKTPFIILFSNPARSQIEVPCERDEAADE